MKLKDIVRQLANRINQPHVIEVYLRQVYAKGFVDGTKRTPWINVNERLPEEGEKVFFVLEWRGIYKDYFGGSYRNGKWETEQRTYAPYSFWGIVTHWMPIPEFNE